MEDNILRFVTILEAIKDELEVAEVNNLKIEIYKNIAKLGIDIGSSKKIVREYINSIDKGEILKSNEEISNKMKDYINKINSITATKEVELKQNVINKLERYLILSHRIKELDKDRINMEETIINKFWEDTKYTTIIKGRKNKVKKLSKSDYRGYFSVTILSNLDKLKIKIIELVTKDNKFNEIIGNMDNFRNILKIHHKNNVQELILKK